MEAPAQWRCDGAERQERPGSARGWHFTLYWRRSKSTPQSGCCSRELMPSPVESVAEAQKLRLGALLGWAVALRRRSGRGAAQRGEELA